MMQWTRKEVQYLLQMLAVFTLGIQPFQKRNVNPQQQESLMSTHTNFLSYQVIQSSRAVPSRNGSSGSFSDNALARVNASFLSNCSASARAPNDHVTVNDDLYRHNEKSVCSTYP